MICELLYMHDACPHLPNHSGTTLHRSHPLSPRLPRPAPPPAVPFNEMLSAQRCGPQPSGWLPCLRVRLHRLEIFTFRRSAQRRCEWAPRRLVLEAPDEEAVQDWAAAISRGIEAAAAGRPK